MSTPQLPWPVDSDPHPPGRALAERPASVPMPAPPPQSQFGGEESEGDELNLRELWQVILKRRWTILIFTLIVVTAVVTATYLMTPIYRASLTLQIDREDIKIMQMGEVEPTEGGRVSQDYYQTQYELLKSRSLALRVINQLGLADLPPAPAPPSPLTQFKQWLAGWLPKTDDAKPEPPSENARIEGVISGFLGKLTVEPVRNSRLVKLHYDSPDPRQAAAILNAVAKSYINLNLERRFDASSYARNFLQERLQQVKVKLEDSERQLVDFARQQGIINVDDKQSIVTQSLSATNAALSAAEAKRIAAEAAYRQMNATRGQGASQILDSKTIQTLKETKAKLEAQYQDSLSIYKPAYPTMVQLRNQIGQLDSLINQEIASIRSAVTATYESARAEEALLQASLNQTKKDVLELQSRSIQFNILRRGGYQPPAL